jgi:hypothetical protein
MEQETSGNTICHICGIPLREDGNINCSAKHGNVWPAEPSMKTKLFSTVFDKLKKPKEIMKEALVTELNIRLEDITVPQREFFYRIYPKGFSSMTQEQLCNAIDLCHRTITKNNLGRTQNDDI